MSEISGARLPYAQLAPAGIAKMSQLEHYLNTASGLEQSLLGLVRLRASLINGCEYCIHLHTTELQSLNETAERIAAAGTSEAADMYSPRELAAFAWTDAVTNIREGHADDRIYDRLREHFSDVEIVNLTLAITTINAWNRIAIALGAYPGHRGTAAL